MEEYFAGVVKSVEPVQYVLGLVAVAGGIARYLNGYAGGKPFKLGIFLASTFVSGFSGWLFALIGQSLEMPISIIFIMAGTGGFLGEQTMKLVVEWVKGRIA